jgi:hypothetical protein
MTAHSATEASRTAVESFAPTISYVAVPPVQAALDRERGVLSLTLSSALSIADTTFDDDEVFVFRAATDGRVLGFEIPHFLTYWQMRIAELAQHLSDYSPGLRREIERCLQAIDPGAAAVEAAMDGVEMSRTATNSPVHRRYGITMTSETSGSVAVASSRVPSTARSPRGDLAAPLATSKADIKPAPSRAVFLPTYRRVGSVAGR